MKRLRIVQGERRCCADRLPLKDGTGAQCMLPRRKGTFFCHVHQDYPIHDSRIEAGTSDVRPVREGKETR